MSTDNAESPRPNPRRREGTDYQLISVKKTNTRRLEVAEVKQLSS